VRRKDRQKYRHSLDAAEDRPDHSASPKARGLRDTAIHHLDAAMQGTQRAFEAAQRGR
jgi:hypothetical protein